MQEKLRLKLSKKFTLILSFVLIVIIVGRIFVLVKSGFSVSSEGSFAWAVGGVFTVFFFFWWARYYEQRTAKSIFYYAGILTIVKTAYQTALFMHASSTVLLSIYLLSMVCEMLIVFGCFIHVRELGVVKSKSHA